MFVSNLWTMVLLMFFLGLGLVRMFVMTGKRSNLSSTAKNHAYFFFSFFLSFCDDNYDHFCDLLLLFLFYFFD